jgi:hypothetical protein
VVEKLTVRSVDMQVLLPKIQEIGKNQQVQNQQDQSQQQQFAAQMQKQAELQKHRVQNSPKSEGHKIDVESEKKGHQQKKRHSDEDKKQEHVEGETGVKDPSKGNLLDIKI